MRARTFWVTIWQNESAPRCRLTAMALTREPRLELRTDVAVREPTTLEQLRLFAQRECDHRCQVPDARILELLAQDIESGVERLDKIHVGRGCFRSRHPGSEILRRRFESVFVDECDSGRRRHRLQRPHVVINARIVLGQAGDSPDTSLLGFGDPSRSFVFRQRHRGEGV